MSLSPLPPNCRKQQNCVQRFQGNIIKSSGRIWLTNQSMTSFFSAWLQKSTEIREHCSEALRGCCGITVVPLCVAPISREYIQDHSPHISMACFQIVVIGYG